MPSQQAASSSRPQRASDPYTPLPSRTIRRANDERRRCSDPSEYAYARDDSFYGESRRGSGDSGRRGSDATLYDSDEDADEYYTRPKAKGKLTRPPLMYGSSEYPGDVRVPSEYAHVPRRSSSATEWGRPSSEQPREKPRAKKGKGRSALGRFKDFLVWFAAEPALPPSRGPSRTNSAVGAGAGVRPAQSRWNSNTNLDDCDQEDMFQRAQCMNGEENEAQRTVYDEADVAEKGKAPERPFFLRHRAPEQSAVDDDAVSVASRTTATTAGGRGVSYRQRRKRQKHRIIYHRDTVDAQQRFILTLSKALLVFGSLSHRIEPQLVSVAAVFELPAQFVHVPGCVQVSFGDPEVCASETLFIKAASGLDLGRISETHAVYRAVVRDEISATVGRERLEELLRRPPLYTRKLGFALTFLQGFILCGTSFGGSLNDMWVAGILATAVSWAQQKAARSELSSSGADIFIAATVSFIARALSVRVPGRIFCYQAISSTSITGLLPGSLMLSGVLDIASRNIYLGAPKIVTGLLTSLYLGFGLTIGSDVWLHIDSTGRHNLASFSGTHKIFNGSFAGNNATTPESHALSALSGVFTFSASVDRERSHTIQGCHRDPTWPGVLQPIPWWSLFVLLPVLNLVLSMKRNQPWKSRDMPVMIAISCTANAFTQLGNRKFHFNGHPDYVALAGSFIVSILGNLYSRKFGGTAFTIMLTGIWLLIPTGLSEAGGLANTYHAPGQDEYTSSLDLARKMISVIIGVMSGVYLSARIIYTFGKKKNSALVTF